MTMRNDHEDERVIAPPEDREGVASNVAADPDAEDDNSPKAETSVSLLYLGFGIPFILFVSTGVFGAVNGDPVFTGVGFGVAAVLVLIALWLLLKLIRANRHRSHH